MKRYLARIGLALGLFVGALTSPNATAQCTIPDGLSGGPCCAPAGVNLPVFPMMPGEDARFLCFDSCQLSLDKLYCVTIGQPKPLKIGGVAVCGQYNIRFQLRDCASGALAWSGAVKASYSRNWQETAPGVVAPNTVWRFVINGDFLPGAALAASPCDRPGCLSTYSRVYFSGHIDYTLNCVTNQWDVAWALSHECDPIHHSTASLRPAPAVGFHPTQSFSIVGPGATFAPSSTLPIVSNGPIVQGAMRWNNWGAAPMICTFEEQANGSVVANSVYCQCSNAAGGGAPQSVDTFVAAQAMCGSWVTPAAGSRFTQKQIGRWTAPGSFPGNEFLLFDYGDLQWGNGCTGTVNFEWYEGSETIGGWPATDLTTGAALGRQFEDFGSSNVSATNPGRRLGAPHVSYSMLHFNLP